MKAKVFEITDSYEKREFNNFCESHNVVDVKLDHTNPASSTATGKVIAVVIYN